VAGSDCKNLVGAPEHWVFFTGIGLKQFSCLLRKSHGNETMASLRVLSYGDKKSSCEVTGWPVYKLKTSGQLANPLTFQLYIPQAKQRVFNKISIQMRVPIENGSGCFNQVSDFIKLPAA
jgi:hypothetical protein